jgi:thioredoxin reductase (NADPH)
LEDRIYDLIIIGGGPAGLTAGLYAARGRIDCVLLEKLSPGGQVLNTDWVENWPGDKGISGFDLVDKMRAHAEHFGLPIENKEVVGLNLTGKIKEVTLADGVARCKSLIIASGANPTKLRVKGEELLAGRGVSYCGTCDGPFYRDQVVASVGGGDTAVEESIFLTKFARKVYLIHRRDKLRAAKIAQERAIANEKIECVWDTVVKSIEGHEKVERIHLVNVKTGQESSLDVDGVFVFVGVKPNTDFIGDGLERDMAGFIKTNLEMETSIDGVFAAGDVIIKQMRQICTAVGDGATALHSAQLYLEEFE